MRKYIYCDNCREETLHEVVREEKSLYKCLECGSHTISYPEREINLRAIISSGANSQRAILKAKESDVLEVGDEYIVDTPEGHKIGEITSIELENGKRVDKSEARRISTVWLRDVGEVLVRFSLHKRSVTSPYKMVTDGETEFEVGETVYIDGKRFRIHRIKLIEGDVLRKEGNRAKAKEIRRIYAKYERR
jgi:uncharacterized Zn finger protein